MDIAELGVRVTQTGVAETTAGLRGLSSAASQASATTADFARAGATASQVAQLTGVSLAQARTAVATFGGTTAETAMEARGLALAEQEAAAAGIELGAATGVANLGLGRLRQSMATLAAESLGLNPIAGRLGSTMAGAFGAGTIAVIGLLGAITAGKALFDAWNEDESKAKAEQDKLTDSLMTWYEKTKEGPAGELTKQIDAMTKKVHGLRTELDGVAHSSFFSEAGMIGAGGSVKDALIRIFTAGSVTQMAIQAGVEVNKGTAAVVQQIKDGGDAIAAAKVEAAKRIADAGKPTAADRAFDRAQEQQIDGIIDRWNKEQKAADDAAKALKKLNDERAKAADDAVSRQGNKAYEAVQSEFKDQVEAAQKAAAAQQAIVDTALKDEQRAFADFFDNVLQKGITNFTSLFDSIRDLFFKMIADMAAADVMKKIAAPISAVIGGILGMPSTATAQGSFGVSAQQAQGLSDFAKAFPTTSQSITSFAAKGIGAAGAGFGIGSMIGGILQQRGAGEGVSVLGGAAGGAATGAMIGGPWGALIGGVAGAAGALLGFSHSASEAAKALLAYQTAADGVADSLAGWRAQITGTAADQKAAALLDLQVKYDQMQQAIQQAQAGKKHEAERNLELAQAEDLYNKQRAAIENNTAAWQANTGAINAVQGYRYESLYYGSMPTVGKGGNTGNGGDSTDPPPITINHTTVLDGEVVARSVLKTFQKSAKRLKGDSTRWPEIAVVT